MDKPADQTMKTYLANTLNLAKLRSLEPIRVERRETKKAKNKTQLFLELLT